MPSFDSTNMFGSAVTMTTVDNPRAVQVNAFPGLNGTEELDQGKRGRFVNVDGWLSGDNPDNLNGNEMFFRSYDDGRAYVLVDTFGNVWPNAKMESFEPQGRVRVSAGTGFFYRPYKARFRIL